MRVAQVFHVVDQQRSQLTIIEVLASILRSLPRAEMDFVDRDGLLVPVLRFAAGHPVAVAPRVAVQVVDDRRALRRNLGGKSVRIDLLKQMAFTSPQGKLVGIPLLQSRHEPPPDTVVTRMERVAAVHPRVHVAQERDLGGVRCPHGKLRSGHAVLSFQVCAQVAVERRFHP